MIFVTVGTQGPFDRLVRCVDAWAAERGDGVEVVAQIGDSEFHPAHLDWHAQLSPDECAARFAAADAVVAHAGMGTILTCLELGKPLVVMPRRAALGEQRNDHQLATARRFDELGSVRVAFDEGELAEALSQLDELRAGARIRADASPELLEALRAFIAEA